MKAVILRPPVVVTVLVVAAVMAGLNAVLGRYWIAALCLVVVAYEIWLLRK